MLIKVPNQTAVHLCVLRVDFWGLEEQIPFYSIFQNTTSILSTRFPGWQLFYCPWKIKSIAACQGSQEWKVKLSPQPLEHDVNSAVRPLGRPGAQAMWSSPWAMLGIWDSSKCRKRSWTGVSKEWNDTMSVLKVTLSPKWRAKWKGSGTRASSSEACAGTQAATGVIGLEGWTQEGCRWIQDLL